LFAFSEIFSENGEDFFERMKGTLAIIQIVISILLALSILVQQRGSGLGSLAGGSGDGFHAERRGAEKLLFNLTVFLGFAFCANAFVLSFLGE